MDDIQIDRFRQNLLQLRSELINLSSTSDDAAKTVEYKFISVAPYTTALGAEISGINLADSLSPEVIAEIRRAWLENIVVFFRDQKITPRQQHNFFPTSVRFAKNEARVPIPRHPEVPSVLIQEYDQNARIGADYRLALRQQFPRDPTEVLVLYAIDVPPAGGDTCWINMNAAYEALSSPLRQLCDELTAIHDLVSIMGPGIRDRAGIEAFTKFAESTPPVEHPLVRVNPDSGKRCLYVNPLMTARIKNVSPIESQSILNMLFDHITQEEFMIRFRWEKNSVAFWDNRSSIHRGINDFYPQHRLMHRVFIDEETRPSAS